MVRADETSVAPKRDRHARSVSDARAITDTLIKRDVKLRLAATVHASLLDGGPYVRIVEELQGLKICCLNEIAGRQGFITSEQLARIVEPLRKSGRGEYLLTQLHFAGYRNLERQGHGEYP